MFDALPPELVRLIIELAVPQTYHSTTYKDRQKTLCNLCLVSRQFLYFARPFLLKMIRIRSRAAFDLASELLNSSRGGGQSVRHVFCDEDVLNGCLWFDQAALDALPETYPQLEHLVLSVIPQDTVCFDALARLRRKRSPSCTIRK